jgi:hypothetical protein
VRPDLFVLFVLRGLQARKQGIHLHQLLVLTLDDVALDRARLLRDMVKVEGALRLDVVVPAVAQRVVRADEHLGAAAGELGRRELLLVVLFVGRRQLRLHRVVFENRFDGLGDVGELRAVSGGLSESVVGQRGLLRQGAHPLRRKRGLVFGTCLRGIWCVNRVSDWPQAV